MLNKNRGITLIALIITIIVLLILAGVTIAMIMGDNGILNQATTASDRTVVSTEQEQVELAYTGVKTLKEGGSFTVDELQDELDNIVGDGLTTASLSGSNVYKVLFKETNNTYEIKDGKVSEIEPVTVPDEYVLSFDFGWNGTELTSDITGYLVDLGNDEYELIFVGSGDMANLNYYPSGLVNYSCGYSIYSWNYLIINAKISEGIKTLGAGIFSHCESLHSVILPESLENIDSSCFEYCTSIDTLIIPESVITIENGAFNGWTSEQTIYVPFNDGELPSDWSGILNCGATIIYANS